MNPLFRSRAAFDDEALDRALSQTETPPVPSGLADRIVATVTALPQEQPASATAAPSPHKSRPPRLALAASIAAVVVLSAGALVLWQADSRQEGRDRGANVAFAEAPAARHVASSANSARETSLNPASANSATGNGNVRVVATSSDLARIPNEPGPSAAPNDTTEGTPAPSTEAGDQLAHDAGPSLPAHPSETRDPIGPSLAGREGPVSTPDGAVYGPPAPQGLGIAGGGSSQAPNSPPVANDPGGTGSNRQGPKTGPAGGGPGGRGPGSRR